MSEVFDEQTKNYIDNIQSKIKKEYEIAEKARVSSTGNQYPQNPFAFASLIKTSLMG